ncbi:MAG TPA: TRAP transporter substrate-binding protein DctP, partial [Burkholderiales bacterium]|nr:TRAP transporter substrate-binding protein DctP [Burkholderiales bacterium]
LRLVRSGQVDVGSAPLGMVAGDAPLLDGMDLAGLAPDIQTARRIADALTPHVNRDLERIGIRMVATLAFSKQVMFCRKAVPSLTDLQGMKVRAAGPSLGDLVRSFNGQPVSVNFGEVYTALERGTIDCAVTGTGGGNSAKWTEVTSHLVNYPMQWAVAGYYVNLAWWNKLDAPVRALLEKTFQEITDKQWALGSEITEDGLACNFGNAPSCKIHTLLKKPLTEVKAGDAASAAAVRKQLVEVVLPNWVKRCGERCGQIYNDVVAPISGVKYTPR